MVTVGGLGCPRCEDRCDVYEAHGMGEWGVYILLRCEICGYEDAIAGSSQYDAVKRLEKCHARGSLWE